MEKPFLCFVNWKVAVLFPKEYQKIIGYLVSLSILFPKGIGIAIGNNVLDVNKILILISVLFAIKINKSLIINKYTLFIILFIFLIFLQSYSWHDSTQYIFLIFYILFYFSSYFVGKSILTSKDSILNFAAILSKLYLFFTPVAMLDYFFRFMPLALLRPHNEGFSIMKNRGEIGGVKLDYYMGFDFNLHYFTFDRAVLFSLLFLILILFKSSIKNKKLITLFLVVISIVMVEIILSQARFTTLFCAVLYLFVLFKYWRKKIVIFAIATIGLGIILSINRVLYYIAGVISLFNLIGLSNTKYSSLKFVLETDKRYEAITNFFTKFIGGEFNFLSAQGPLFFNFQKEIMGVPADNWDDVTAILNSILEFGFIPWLLIVSVCIHLFWKNKSRVGKNLFLLILMTMFFTIPTFSPRFYYYFFFLLGGIVANKKSTVRYFN